MSKLEDLHTLIRLLDEFELPISPILEYAIKEKMESLSETHIPDVENVPADSVPTEILRASKPQTGSKRKHSIIRVIKTDGSFIECEKTTLTLSNVIKEIGTRRVFDLKIPMDGMYLVTKGGNPQYPSAQYDVGDGFFVNTHSCTATKKRQLEKIFSMLNLDWRVEIINGN